MGIKRTLILHEVDARMDVGESHCITDNIEAMLQKFGIYHAHIHVELMKKNLL